MFHGERLAFQAVVLEQLDICMQTNEFQPMLPLTCRSQLHVDSSLSAKPSFTGPNYPEAMRISPSSLGVKGDPL